MPWKGRHKLDARALLVDYLNGMEALAGKRTPSIHQALPKSLAWHLHHISCMALLHLRIGRVSVIYLFKCSSCRPETIMTLALEQMGEYNGLGLSPRAGNQLNGCHFLLSYHSLLPLFQFNQLSVRLLYSTKLYVAAARQGPTVHVRL